MIFIKRAVILGFSIFCASLSAKSVYVGSSYANAEVDGSQARVFATISEAIDFAEHNDEIIISQGVYREAISIDKPIKLRAKTGDYVLISACDVVDIADCEKRGINGHIVYRLPYDKMVYDMFINAEAMDISRYPNKTEAMLSNKDWLLTDLFPKDNEDSVVFLEKQEGEFKDFIDGYYVGSHDERYLENSKMASYYTLSIPVSKTQADGVVLLAWKDGSSGVKNPSGHFGSGRGVGYIIASSAGFDSYNEYYANGDLTYFILPKGVESAKVEYRTRVVGVNVRADNVEFEGLNFKATSISVKADGFSMKNCTMRFLAPFMHIEAPKGTKSAQTLDCQWGNEMAIGLEIKGNNAVVDSSYFAHSWWSAIRLWGNNSSVTNCYIEDIDWIGRRASAIHSWGDKNYIAHNTIKDTGGAGIEAGNAGNSLVGVYATNNIFEYNHIENATNLLIDQGAFYANQQNGANPYGNCVLRYNVIVNVRPPEKLNWGKNTDCIYIDNNTSGYIVHSNIMINASEAMHYNDFAKNKESVGRDIYFLNNSIYNCNYAFAYGLQKHILNTLNEARKARGEPKMSKPQETNARNLVVMNNVAANVGEGFVNSKVMESPLWTHNYIVDTADYKNPDTYDLTLSASALENQARKIDFDYVLKYAPECAEIDYIGAINPKKSIWNFGSNIKIPSFSKDKALLGL